MKITLAAVRYVAAQYSGNLSFGSSLSVVYDRRFRSVYGCHAHTVVRTWNMMDDCIEPLPASELFWFMTTLRWMKNYPTIRSLAADIEKDEVTLRFYLDKYSDYAARLSVVCYRSVFDVNVHNYADAPHLQQRMIRQQLIILNRDLVMMENMLDADIDFYIDALTAQLESLNINEWMARPRPTMINAADNDDE